MAEDEEGRISRFFSALSSGIQEPIMAQGITIPALYAVSKENLILRTVISKLGQEIFRRGYYWEKKFMSKCVECDEEFQHEEEVCPTCGGETRKPDVDQTTYAKWLFNNENSMDQTFMQIIHEIERDLEIVDDAFLVDPETNEVSFYRVKDIVRGDPVFMRIVADKRGVRGGRYKTCLIHRDQVHSPGQEGNCEICGSKMHEVHYVNMAGSGKTQYYVDGEVIHISKYQYA